MALHRITPLMFEIGLIKTFQKGGLVVEARSTGPIDWPARSPDLTPTDYFMWGCIKDIVYNNKPTNLADLKQSIVTAFHTIDTGLCKKVCESVPERLQLCKDLDGKHIEQFL